MEITIPYKFAPREYQLSFLKAMDSDYKRAVCVWHRRAGKDKTFLNFMIKKMLERKGTYYYYFPTHTMGRKILWDGMDRDGMNFLDHFPEPLIGAKNQQEMKIQLTNGSVFQIIGTDRLDVVGTNPVGCVFSEYSLQNPTAWDFVRPILAENNGWAVFNYTPRGNNHGKELFDMAQGNSDWFCELLTVDNTRAVSQEAIEADRQSGMAEDMVMQEYYCSWTLGIEGAYYAKLIGAAYNDNPPRIGFYPHEADSKVYTFWDLGIDDDTAIWFVQFIGNEIRLIDYYANRREGLSHYAKVLEDTGYLFNQHWFPFDVEQSMQGEKIETRLDILRNLLGAEKCRVVPKHSIAEGIASVKSILPKCRFNESKTEVGIKSLENYRQKYEERIKKYSDKPLHDWSSHASDAFRYMATIYRQYQFEGRRMGDIRQEMPLSNRERHASVDKPSNLLKRGMVIH